MSVVVRSCGSVHQSAAGSSRTGQVILVPTDAAPYTTEGPATEVAAVRSRALEFDRAVLQAGPTRYTTVVGPGGRMASQSGLRTAEVFIVSFRGERT